MAGWKGWILAEAKQKEPKMSCAFTLIKFASSAVASVFVYECESKEIAFKRKYSCPIVKTQRQHKEQQKENQAENGVEEGKSRFLFVMQRYHHPNLSGIISWDYSCSV